MEVARAGGGVTRAAARLSLTPSAVSQSVKALEGQLDVSLFDRAGNKLALSPEGAALFEGLSRYQDGLLESLRRIREGRVAVKGQLRLGVFYGFSNALIAGFVAALRRDHPDLVVEVRFGAPSELDRLLCHRRLDFALNLFKAKPELKIEGTLLAVDELWLVSARQPPRRPLGLDELRRAPFIDYYPKSRLITAWVSHHFAERVRDLPIVTFAANSELAVHLILEGVGIGIVASSIARPHVDDRRLFVIRGKR